MTTIAEIRMAPTTLNTDCGRKIPDQCTVRAHATHRLPHAEQGGRRYGQQHQADGCLQAVAFVEGCHRTPGSKTIARKTGIASG